MGELDISYATASNMATNVASYSVASQVTDGATGDKETTWINSDWSKYWGYFNEIAELKSAMLMKAIWVCGKGWTADPETKVILDHISGWGKDSFDDILFNAEVTMRVSGDAWR